MGDNRGQTIFLSVIGIATLLVAIIGATFAYFTTQVTKNDINGGSLSGTTANVGGTTFTFSETNEKSYINYPGGLAVLEVTATFAKDASNTATNSYEATYNLQIDYTNETSTDLTYALYALDNPIEMNNITCTLHSEQDAQDSTKLYLWYGEAGNKTSNCAIATEESVFPDGNKITNGTLTKEKSESQKITASLDGQSITTSSTEAAKKYYYLVVKYPNVEGTEPKDQNADANAKAITASLTIVPDSIAVEVTE